MYEQLTSSTILCHPLTFHPLRFIPVQCCLFWTQIGHGEFHLNEPSACKLRRIKR